MAEYIEREAAIAAAFTASARGCREYSCATKNQRIQDVEDGFGYNP